MKKPIFLFTALIFSIRFVCGQTSNLVLNPSFEEMLFNPDIEFVNDTLYSEYFHKCCNDQFGVYKCDTFCVKFWHTKIDRHIWYFSDKIKYICHYSSYNKNGIKKDSVTLDKDFKVYGVPYNLNGNIPAASGSSYIGFVPIWWGGGMNPLTGTIKTPLIKDSTYKFSFYFRNAGDQSFFLLKKIEVIFSKELDPFHHSYQYFQYDDLFKNKSNRIKQDLVFKISEKCDSLYWKKYEATYVAKGGERYFSIGIFFQNEELSKDIQDYRMNYKNENWEKRFFVTHSKNILFEKNKCYSTSYLRNWGSFDLTKRAFYLIDDVSLVPVSDL